MTWEYQVVFLDRYLPIWNLTSSTIKVFRSKAFQYFKSFAVVTEEGTFMFIHKEKGQLRNENSTQFMFFYVCCLSMYYRMNSYQISINSIGMAWKTKRSRTRQIKNNNNNNNNKKTVHATTSMKRVYGHMTVEFTVKCTYLREAVFYFAVRLLDLPKQA